MNQNQQRCFKFIKSYIASNGCSPSYREMADYLGLASKNSIFVIVNKLKDEGYIKFDKRRQRGIQLVECEKCEKLQKQLDMAIKCLERYADHDNWQDECAGASDCLFKYDYGYREAETVLEQIKEQNNESK